MTTSTHVAASCLLAACALRTGLGPLAQAMAASAAALLAHLVLDMVPHGFVATPTTMFKKAGPTLAELLPAMIILGTALVLFGRAPLFLAASFFGIVPDMVSVVFYKRSDLIAGSSLLLTIHRLHRKAHWFEDEQADGTVINRFHAAPLLSIEALLGLCFCGLALWLR